MLPTLGLAECYCLCDLLSEKLIKEANAHTSPMGVAIATLSDAQHKIKMALEKLGVEYGAQR